MTDAELLATIATRVADGIALGGDYDSLFYRYVEAHNDRATLFRLLNHPKPQKMWLCKCNSPKNAPCQQCVPYA